MIRVDALSLRLAGRPVLENVSLEIRPGRVTVILGPNGAGKSSLLRGLAGLISPSKGQVTLDATPVISMPATARARRIGYLPQNGAPAWPITVRDLVALGRLPLRSPFAAPTPVDAAEIDAALAATDLSEFADRKVDSLSGGELARAKLARVLAGGADWILADEPLANLDPAHQRDVLALLRAAADAGKGVVVVLHQLSAALRLADDLVLLRSGQLLGAGPCETLATADNLSQTFGMPLDVVRFEGRVAILPR